MIVPQKLAYLACLAELERALRDVQRAAVMTQVGLNRVVSLNALAQDLTRQVEETRAERRKPAPKPQPAPRDTSPMRPSFTGD